MSQSPLFTMNQSGLGWNNESFPAAGHDFVGYSKRVSGVHFFPINGRNDESAVMSIEFASDDPDKSTPHAEMDIVFNCTSTEFVIKKSNGTTKTQRCRNSREVTDLYLLPFSSSMKGEHIYLHSHWSHRFVTGIMFEMSNGDQIILRSVNAMTIRLINIMESGRKGLSLVHATPKLNDSDRLEETIYNIVDEV